MKSEIINRIASLRNFMRKHKLSAFIIPSTDPHSGEYIPKHWEARKWISGFTGSAGTVVVTLDKAGLWTDSRYFLQAAEQLENTGITLFKERLPETPSIVEWLGCVLNAEDNVGIDGWVNSYQETSNLQKELEKKQIHLTLAPDPFNELWTDRPALPDNKVFIHELKYAGLSYKDKITQIREAIRRNSCTGILISALDEVAWTLNLRGSDVHCNPVFVSYLLITEYSSTLYIIENKLSDERGVPYDIVCGTFFMAGLGSEDFTSLTDDQIRRYKKMFDNRMVFTVPAKAQAEKNHPKKGKSHER